MDDQDELFSEFKRKAYARHSDPRTSHEAAESMEKLLPHVEHEILQAVRRSNGLTTHEIADATGIPYWTVTPRLKPLARKGWVVDSGELRAGESGRRCIVWRAV